MRDLTLSVVIPSYNSARYIEACLRSIEGEKQDDVEFILVDGASVDRTIEIAKHYSDLFSQMISEPDNGQSEALNKGFALAQGRYLTWLNSDDIFLPGALAEVLNELRNGHSDWYAANCMFLDAHENVMRCCCSGGYEDFAVRRGVLNVFAPSTIFSRTVD